MPKQTLKETGFEKRFDELFVQAEEADKALGKFISRVCQSFPGRILRPGLKKKDSARDKLLRDENDGVKTTPDDPSTLKDISRATIEYSTLQALYSAREFIKRQVEFTSGGEMKDRYQDKPAMDGGYRDVKFFLGMVVQGEKRHFVELQLNISTVLKGKELEHPIYEILRRSGSPEQPRPVMIPAAEAAKLGPRLRRVFVALKQGNIVQEHHLRALQPVVLKFFQQGSASKPTLVPVMINSEEIKKMQAITPELYKSSLDRALHAKIITGQGLTPMMQEAEYRALTSAR